MDEQDKQLLAKAKKAFQEIQNICQEYQVTEGDPFVLSKISNKADYGRSQINRIK
ncbi:hypothetical protein ACFLT9_10910 [Acidobacteriota bacterium]